MMLEPILKNNKLNEIVELLISSDLSKYNNGNLLGDKTSVSLFMFYYSMLSKKENHYNFAFDILEEVVGIHSKIDVIPISISKFGWLLLHLNRKGIIETDLDELYELGKVENQKIYIDYKNISTKMNRYYKKIKELCKTCYMFNACEQCVFQTNLEKSTANCNYYYNKEKAIAYLKKQLTMFESNRNMYNSIIKKSRII